MRLVRNLIDRLDGERRATRLARELRGLGQGELRRLGIPKGDVLRVARLAAYRPLAELPRLEPERGGGAAIGRIELPWLLGQAMSLRAA